MLDANLGLLRAVNQAFPFVQAGFLNFLKFVRQILLGRVHASSTILHVNS